VSVEPVRLARAALTRLAEPARAGLWQLVADFGPVAAVERLRAADPTAEGAGGLPADVRSFVLARRGEDRAGEDLAAAAAVGARLVIPEDPEWPGELLDPLRHLHRPDDPAMPPLALWVRGPLRLDEACRRAVAVVGARAATSYGGFVAGEFGYGLAERGWTVVSGGAYGIDAAAHRGALAGDGPTVAVLACGVDRPYPAGNAALFDRIAATGLLVSEWPPGSTPQRLRFLVRNRVIAALAAGTVVVEAAARSGARQTARKAEELSRAVLAVPGPVTSAMSVGCHQLLRHCGARLVTDVGEVIEELTGLGAVPAAPPRGPEDARDTLGEAGRRILDGVPARAPAPVDAVARAAGVPLWDAARMLPELAAAGLVEEAAGGWVLAAAGRPARPRPGAPRLTG